MSDVGTTERAIAAQLRSVAIDHITDRQLSNDQVAERLGVAGRTAQLLLSRPTWDFEVAVRVVDQLGLTVKIAQVTS